jgi:hypothetical protein
VATLDSILGKTLLNSDRIIQEPKVSQGCRSAWIEQGVASAESFPLALQSATAKARCGCSPVLCADQVAASGKVWACSCKRISRKTSAAGLF